MSQYGVLPDEINLTTTLKAIAYTEVLKSHARRVFALGENQIFSLAQILIGKVKKGELRTSFTQRELARQTLKRTKNTGHYKRCIKSAG